MTGNAKLDALLGKLERVKAAGDGWEACCPGHDDRNASLSIGIGDDGRLLVHCHAGCDPQAVVSAVGWKLADLMPSSNGHAGNGHTTNGTGKPKRAKKLHATAADAIAAYRLGDPSAVWKYHDAAGLHVGSAVRWDTADGKKIFPISRNGAGWNCAGMPEPRPLYELPTLADAPLVVVTEGEKAADAARSIELVATTSAHGAKSPGKTDWRPLAGKDVAILPDNDDVGRKYAETVASILTKLDPPASVKIVTLPGLPDGGDMVDWIEAHGEAAEPEAMLAEIQQLISAAPEWTPKAKGKREGKRSKPKPQAYTPGGRVEIEITTAEDKVNQAVVNALAGDPDLYVRGGNLVDVADDDGVPVIRQVPEPLIRNSIAAAVQFFTLLENENGGGGKIPQHPPVWCVKAVDEWGRYPKMRNLLAVLTVPTIRSDGSLLAAPGYDPKTKLLYLPGECRPDVSERPTRADALAARDKLLDLVCDFPFRSTAHVATWLAYLLTLVARYAYKGCAPLFAFDGTVAGTGKGLLANVSFVIPFGREAETFTNPRDDDEARKRITSLAISGRPAVLIDNIAGAFGSPSMDAALTSQSWGDRLLGLNKDVSLPLRVVWALTANNLILKPDTTRRVAPIRLESQHERPEERTGFKYPNLLAHVSEHRPELLGAALTCLRGWFAAGKPTQEIPAWGSYEGWSAVIRQAIVWLELPDPASTREEFRQTADREGAAFHGLIEGLLDADPAGYGLQAAQIVDLTEKEPQTHATLRNALLELCSTPGGKLGAKSVGRTLAHLRGRLANGRCIDSIPASGGKMIWIVRTIGELP